MNVQVEPGDFVIDRLDDNRLREVDYVNDATDEIHFRDGGVMGTDEPQDGDVLLPSEVG